ncbi:GNAT family N-acetyltransferase [Tunturiibacter lichenicola]|uniref:GNAT family N-acetyltransferase n=1 Tax=Tunturiibacter lichenicola TaxID=2051959 RepID=UPI0021B35EF5|nr:GNAT family N-acetyltransferase [Edaphobacter lichenicola]
MPNIQIATMPSEIDRCFPVMLQLRPMLVASEFVARIQTQQAEGYQLAFLEVEDAIVSVAGFRVQTLLWSGKTLYVDDLVTDEAARSKGHGESMLTWLIALAKEAGCTTFMLDSGTQRHEAHAFYFRHGLRISDFHFKLAL